MGEFRVEGGEEGRGVSSPEVFSLRFLITMRIFSELHFLSFCSGHRACRILVPPTGIKGSLVLLLNIEPSGKFPMCNFFKWGRKDRKDGLGNSSPVIYT